MTSRETATRPQTIKKVAVSASKIVISGLVIYWLSRKFDYRDAVTHLLEASLGSLILLCFTATIQVVLLGIRWHAVAKWWRSTLKMGGAFSTLLAGLFFGQAMPSSVGGDAVRILILNRRHEFGLGAAVIATTTDRAIGIVGLLVIPLALLPFLAKAPWAQALLPTPAVPDLIHVGVTAIVAALILFAAAGMARKRTRSTLENLSTRVRKLFGLSGTSLQIAFALAVVAHLVMLTGFYAWFHDINPGVPLSTFFFLTPVALFAAALPISIGGWGVREAVFIALFSQTGVAPSQALALGLGVGFLTLAQGIASGALWLLGEAVRNRRKTSTLSRTK